MGNYLVISVNARRFSLQNRVFLTPHQVGYPTPLIPRQVAIVRLYRHFCLSLPMEQDTRGDGRVGSTIIYVAEVSISHKYVFIININFIIMRLHFLPLLAHY